MKLSEWLHMSDLTTTVDGAGSFMVQSVTLVDVFLPLQQKEEQTFPSWLVPTADILKLLH